MSSQDEEEEVEDEENEDQEDEEDGEDDDEDQDEQDEQDEDQDQDQDNDQDEDDEDQDEDEDQQKQQNEEQQQKQQKSVPTFKPLPQQFVFRNLLADIASIGSSVDHFINTLPSRGNGSNYRSQLPPRIEYQTTYTPPVVYQQKKITIMKDEDVQVSMQPQIVIQNTVAPREQIKKEPYKISDQSTKFLAQLYQENKKLKRFQNQSSTNTWYKSKERFSRPEHERGLINLENRNKEIDEAIQMLRREDS